MFRFSFIPPEVRLFLEGLRSCFRYRHFLAFSWLLTLQLACSEQSNLKALSRPAPGHMAYHHLRRFLVAQYWWSRFLLDWFVDQVIQVLPPPQDGICYVLGDSTFKDKRGKKNPAAQKGRKSANQPYLFGIKLVFLVLHWDNYRIPVNFALVRRKTDPEYKKENVLFRQMLRALQPPCWAEHVIVLADAAYASRANLRLIKKRYWFFLMGCARTWKFENGKSLRNLVLHTPKACYKRTWVNKPNCNRRRSFWVFAKRVRLRHLGDVTIVLSKIRPNQSPKTTKILMTNLPKSVSARTLVALYQRRWYVELLIWELKGAVGLGQHQLTKQVERVERSVAINLLAYLMLLKLRGQDIPKTGPWSAFQLKRNFIWQVTQGQLHRSAEKLARKWLRMRKSA